MPTTPDYIRIADRIAAEVRAGILKPGDKLPSFAQMAAQHDVGLSTIQMCYIRLEALGVIRRHQGKGVFITDPDDWPAIGRAHGEVFGAIRPAAAMLVTRLLDPRMRVEIEAVAFSPRA